MATPVTPPKRPNGVAVYTSSGEHLLAGIHPTGDKALYAYLVGPPDEIDKLERELRTYGRLESKPMAYAWPEQEETG